MYIFHKGKISTKCFLHLAAKQMAENTNTSERAELPENGDRSCVCGCANSCAYASAALSPGAGKSASTSAFISRHYVHC